MVWKRLEAHETSKYCENYHEISFCPSTGLLVTGVMVVVMAARLSSDNIPSLTFQIRLVCRAARHQWQLISSRLLISAKMYELFPSLVFALLLSGHKQQLAVWIIFLFCCLQKHNQSWKWSTEMRKQQNITTKEKWDQSDEFSKNSWEWLSISSETLVEKEKNSSVFSAANFSIPRLVWPLDQCSDQCWWGPSVRC